MEHLTREDVKGIIRDAVNQNSAEMELRFYKALTKALDDHSRSCNKVDAWMGKLVFAFIGSGVIVTLIVELVKK